MAEADSVEAAGKAVTAETGGMAGAGAVRGKADRETIAGKESRAVADGMTVSAGPVILSDEPIAGITGVGTVKKTMTVTKSAGPEFKSIRLKN
jgi:hypothetical protein